MIDPNHIDVVPVEELHHRLRLNEPLQYPPTSLHKPFSKWKMEVDDAPILRYLYRHLRPSRHLEFGTWEGTGTCYCLEECDASVWTINLPEGERIEGRPVYYSTPETVPQGAAPVEQRSRVDIYQTAAGAIIGH